MADESDISAALVTVIADAIYPNGTTQPSATGFPTKIYRGWPQASNLDKDLTAQVVNITVGSRDGMSRNTTRYLEQDLDLGPNDPSITGSVSGSTVTLSGTIAPGDMVGLAVLHIGYAYAVQPGDTLASVAAQFATAIGGSSSGALVTVPGTPAVAFAAVSMGQSGRETRRTNQGFTVTVWAFDYPSRDLTAKTVDVALAAVEWIVLPDGTSARIRWAQSLSSDRAENADLYRRDLIYMVEYPTMTISNAARVLFVGATITRLIGATPDGTQTAVIGNIHPA